MDSSENWEAGWAHRQQDREGQPRGNLICVAPDVLDRFEEIVNRWERRKSLRTLSLLTRVDVDCPACGKGIGIGVNVYARQHGGPGFHSSPCPVLRISAYCSCGQEAIGKALKLKANGEIRL